jgi:hypothetical protein
MTYYQISHSEGGWDIRQSPVKIGLVRLIVFIDWTKCPGVPIILWIQSCKCPVKYDSFQ